MGALNNITNTMKQVESVDNKNISNNLLSELDKLYKNLSEIEESILEKIDKTERHITNNVNPNIRDSVEKQLLKVRQLDNTIDNDFIELTTLKEKKNLLIEKIRIISLKIKLLKD